MQRIQVEVAERRKRLAKLNAKADMLAPAVQTEVLVMDDHEPIA